MGLAVCEYRVTGCMLWSRLLAIAAWVLHPTILRMVERLQSTPHVDEAWTPLGKPRMSELSQAAVTPILGGFRLNDLQSCIENRIFTRSLGNPYPYPYPDLFKHITASITIVFVCTSSSPIIAAIVAGIFSIVQQVHSTSKAKQ